MATLNQVNTVFVDNGAAVAAVSTTLSSLAPGQFALVDANSMLALDVAGVGTNLNAKSTVYIAVGEVGGGFKLTNPIKGDSVKKYDGTGYSAAVNKILNVGTGGLPIANETEYELIVLINDDQRPHGQKQTRDVYSYTTSSAATQLELAIAINSLFWMRSQNGSIKEYNDRFVSLNVVGSSAFATNFDNGFTATEGSKILEFGGTGAKYSTGSDIAVGDYLKIQVTNVNGATVEYVWLVAGVDGATVTLDTPFNFASGAYANTTGQAIVEATADDDNYSFDIAGLTPSDSWNGIDTYEVVDFDSSFFASDNPGNDGDQAAVTVVNALEAGIGTGYQVHDMEYAAQGYLGVNSRTRWFDNNINPATDAVVTNAYDIVTIAYEKEFLGDFQQTLTSPCTATLALLDGGAQATATTGFVAILDAWFEDVLGFGAVDGTL
jgi:hypothetical protein